VRGIRQGHWIYTPSRETACRDLLFVLLSRPAALNSIDSRTFSFGVILEQISRPRFHASDTKSFGGALSGYLHLCANSTRTLGIFVCTLRPTAANRPRRKLVGDGTLVRCSVFGRSDERAARRIIKATLGRLRPDTTIGVGGGEALARANKEEENSRSPRAYWPTTFPPQENARSRPGDRASSVDVSSNGVGATRF